MPEPSPKPSPNPSPKPEWFDRVAVAAFLVLFLLPMVARSTLRHRDFPGPTALTKLHSIACLFTKKPQGWSSYFVQVRYPGQVHWVTLDQSELFPLQPFGRRTRMHRLLVAWGAKEGRRTKDMARWVLTEHVARHPDEPVPVAIRFTRSWVIPTRDDPPPEAGWDHGEWLDAPPGNRRVIASYMRDELLPAGEEARGD